LLIDFIVLTGGIEPPLRGFSVAVLIAEPRVELRPERLEPRILKRRTQHYPFVT
jgi:hypothetical protein